MKKTLEPTECSISAQNQIGLLEVPDLSKGKSIIDLINESNLEFKDMDKFQKRVAIAKDVILQIELKKYKPKFGTYVEFHKKGEELPLTISNFKNDNVKCEVCAIGSMFVSSITSADHTHKKMFTDDSMRMISSMSDIFNLKELRLLEYLFEGSDIDGKFTKEGATFHKTIRKFRHGQRGATERLTNIMQNIINNNGKFIFETINF